MIHTSEASVNTSGQGDAIDLTARVQEAVSRAAVEAGVVTIFVTGSTAGLTTIEFESGVVADLDRALERLAPRHGPYDHHRRWGDDNGSAHVRAGLVGPSLSVPFCNRTLMLGTWQQVVLLEFDTRPRTRRLVIQIVGE